MTRSGLGVAMLTSVVLVFTSAPSIAHDFKPSSDIGRPEGQMPPANDAIPFGPPGGTEGHTFPPGKEPGPAFDPAFELAQELSGIETYVGITAAQIDAWRGYTSALIDFIDAGKPPEPASFGHNHRPDPASAGKNTPLQAELIAEASLLVAESARKLKDSVSALTAVLSPEQLERLSKADGKLHLFGPPPPPFDAINFPPIPNGG